MNKDYKTPKWEKRKNKIQEYEKSYFERAERSRNALNLEDASKVKEWLLLKLTYAEIIEIDYVNGQRDAFLEHLNCLLQYAYLCCKAYKDGVEMQEAFKRNIAAELTSGYEGYFALIAGDESTLINVTNEEHSIRKMLESKNFSSGSDEYNEIEDMIHAIVENDSERFNKALRERIRIIRRMPIDYYFCFDVWSVGLIKYAEKLGMKVDRDKYIEADLCRIGL